MPKSSYRVYWDSCIFIALLNNEPDRAEVISNYLNHINLAGNIKICTSAISMAEVAYTETEKKERILNQDIEKTINRLWNNDTIEVIEAQPFIMLKARDLLRWAVAHSIRLKTFDAIQLATATFVKEQIGFVKELHTYDLKNLEKFKDHIGIPIINPPVIDPPKPKEVLPTQLTLVQLHKEEIS